MTVDPKSRAGREPRAQRVDAQRNYERILDVARSVIEEQGTEASLRDIARRADIGLGTLYRHFPTRDALLETLLRQRFARLAARADELGAQRPAGEALTVWLREFGAGANTYRGLAASRLATLGTPGSPLHDSCTAMRAAAATLLRRAQEDGLVRPDVDGTDLVALVNAVGWIADQAPVIAVRRDHLFELVMDGLTAESRR
jgi:AcrR family transcriptional regulator